jgi:hypothetical protein
MQRKLLKGFLLGRVVTSLSMKPNFRARVEVVRKLECYEPSTVELVVIDLAKVDDILKESGVREFQQKMYTSEGMDS